jgi:Flp pilus assembly protein TadD
MQICDREQASHKKPVIATDQLYTLGVMEHNRGDYMNAVSYFRHSLEKNPKSDHIYYSLAASFAMKGDTAQALLNLQKAIELNEENRVYAKNDSDFTSLHGEKEFGELVGWSQPAASGQH